jgi:hypothetical protein
MAETGEFVSGGRFVHAQSFTGPVLDVFFRSSRRQAAYDHKRDQDSKKDSKFQRVLHAFLRRPRRVASSLTQQPRQLRAMRPQ